MAYSQNWDASTSFPALWWTTGATPLTYWTIDTGAPAGSLSGNNALTPNSPDHDALAIYQGLTLTDCTVSASVYFPAFSILGEGDATWYLYGKSNSETDVYTTSVFAQVYCSDSANTVQFGYVASGVTTTFSSQAIGSIPQTTWLNVNLTVTGLAVTVTIQRISDGFYWDNSSETFASDYAVALADTLPSGWDTFGGYSATQCYPNVASPWLDDFAYGPPAATLTNTDGPLTLTSASAGGYLEESTDGLSGDPITLAGSFPGPGTLDETEDIIGGITLKLHPTFPGGSIAHGTAYLSRSSPLTLHGSFPGPGTISAYRYAVTVTVPHANLTEDLARFPLLVRVPIDPSHLSAIQAKDSTGHALACRIVLFDDDAGALVCYVRTDLSAEADTVLTLEY